MEERVTPGAFYGSAIAALVGLLFGLMLHGGWEGHPGGPQLRFSSAQAAELPTGSPASASDDQQADGEQLAQLDAAYYVSDYNDPGYIPPDPLPVTRLAPDRFALLDADEAADVKPASAGEAELKTLDEVAEAAGPAQNPDLD